MIGLRVYNNGSKEFFTQDTNEYTLTVHVKVTKKLNPPKVELKITTQTPKLVTGYPRWVDDLETILDGWGALMSMLPFDDLEELSDKKVPFGKRITKYISKNIISGLSEEAAFGLLKLNREPIVEPEVYLEINVSNPDNDVDLRYDIDISSERATDYYDYVVLKDSRGLEIGDDDTPQGSGGGIASAQTGQVWTHRYLLTPEMLYGGGEYQTVVNIRIPWNGYDPKNQAAYEGGVYEESFTLFVTSELGPESMYKELDNLKDIMKDADFTTPPGGFDLLKLIENTKKQSSSESSSKPAQQLKNLLEKPRVVSPGNQ